MDLTVRRFEPRDRAAVVDLWIHADLVRPWNDPDLDIDRKVAVDPEGFLVAVVDDEVVGTVMAGYDGHRGWINYLAVHPDVQGRGLGGRLMRAAEDMLARRGCPKVNLQIRTSNETAIEFYRSIGYEVDLVVSMGRRLVDDDPGSDAG